MPAEHDHLDPADHDACEGDELCEACEDAEDARIGRERLRLARIEGTVSWESVKAEYGL